MADNAYEAVVQKWEETERGWGSRPDGYSLHLTDNDRQKFISEYWANMPATAPSEYSRPDGMAYKTTVDAETFAAIQKSTFGIRRSGRPPGSGGTDGWRPMRQD